MKYFVNEKAKKQSNCTDIIRTAYNGPYGYYANSIYSSLKKSEKKMQADGFKLVELTSEESEKLRKLAQKRANRIARKIKENKLKERAEQISKCMQNEPLPIVSNDGGAAEVSEIVNLTGSMLETYQGCGKGTAYVKDGKLIAWHYGYEKPENAPDVENGPVLLSGTQICFC
ncbi:MAG: hypothetical protein N4A59_06165 [Marinifilum sp.]|jgi:hypothetical protein|nr:hypothetical protein [Marinifilum sp.]